MSIFLLQNLQATFSISLHLPGEMSKEGGVVAGLRRKSARILALEEEKQKQKLNFSSIANNNSINKASPSRNGSFECQQQQHHGVALTSTTMPLTLLKRGRKQKRLEDLVLSSLAQNPSQQSGENSKEGNTSTGHGQQANGLPSTQWVPEKGILELVLDMLQRRDTHKIFAQPVNPIEVETYYTIIKEPMDFGTMRSKLQEGKYTSLEQFEHDVFLISTNAMHFNSSATIYYKEAHGMQELAQMVFRALRTDPYKLKSQLIALTRSGRPGRRPIISEIRGQRTRLPRLSGVKIGASPLGRNSSTLSKRGRPPMNRPWTPFSSQYESLVSSVFNACKILVQNNDNGDFGYKESLLRFVKNLGPTARKVAARKLIQCLPYYQAASSSRQTPIFNPQRTTQRFLLPSPILSFPSRLAYNFQTPNIASLVPNFPRNSNAIPSYGKYNTFNLNLQASPIDHESSGSSNGGTKIHEPGYDGGLKVNNLIMPPPKEKNPIDQDALRKMPFVLDNKMAENGGRDTQYPLKDKMVAETSDFNEKMGKFPWNFLRENVAGQLENNSITSSILDNNIAANRGRDAQFSLKGKIVAEANDFNEQMGNLSGKFLWEDIAGQREKNTQMPSIFDTKIAANRGSDAWFPLKEKMVAETSDFNEKLGNFPMNFLRENVAGQQVNNSQMPFMLDINVAANGGRDAQFPFKGKLIAQTSDFNEKMGNFPGNFLQENVPGQRENNSQMPFILYNNFASNGGRDAQFPFKGKMVAETSDSNEKMGNFTGNFLQENVAGQRGNNSKMPFILDINIAANGRRDAQYPFKGKMVAETGDFKEKMRNFPGNFLQENIAGQLENNSQMPFILDNNITANGGGDNKYPLKGKMVAETSDFNEKMGNSPGNFLLENAAGEQENNSQNKFWLASHFRVIPVHDDDPNTPHASSKTRFRTVDMLAEGDKNNDNNALQKGKQIVVHWPRVEQLSTNWKSRLQDFVHRSNDFKESSFLFPSLEEAIFSSSTAATTTSSLLGVLGRSDGPVGWQGPEMGPNYAGNYTQPLEGGSGFPSFQMLLNNEANSLNQLSYTPLRQDLQPPSSSGQLGVLMPLYNEASNILHGRVDDRDQQEPPLKDSQLPDLALQL